MRVVSGTARGIRLESVPGESTRPILDRVKTALFDILRPELSGNKVLDLFAGSGAVGIEALSQGASHCTFLDTDKRAVATIRNNLRATKLSEGAAVHQIDAFAYLRRCKEGFDLIYIAPPQYHKIWVEALNAVQARMPEILNPEGKVIVQIDPREEAPLSLPTLKEIDRRKYGNTLLLFYKT